LGLQGGESHRTHVTSYGVYGTEPSSWTPAVNNSMPTKGCIALWDLHNDTAAPVIDGPGKEPVRAVCGAKVLENTGCATAS